MKKQAYLTIHSESELQFYCQQLIQNPQISWIAMDTEFVRVDTYFPELSLVQIQDCLGQVAIIDPIAIAQSATSSNPLASLVDVLADSQILKVFHSARQDIEVLYQLANKMPASIFDTQIAAVFFQHGDIAGFARVIEAELGIKLDKSQTRTNWHHRPLSDKQIDYALDDVRFLAPLYEKFMQNLSAEQVAAIMQDCEVLLDETLYKPNPATAGEKIKGLKGFKPKQLAIVNSLATWREQFAIDHNKPKKWVLSDEVIIGIAKRPPITVEALYKVPLIKASSVKGYGAQWISLIDAVFAMPPESWPQPPPKQPPLSPQQDVLIELCLSYAHQVALQYHVNLHNLIHKHEIEALLAMPQTMALSGWRQLLIGQPLQALLSGQSQLQILNQTLVLQSAP